MSWAELAVIWASVMTNDSMPNGTLHVTISNAVVVGALSIKQPLVITIAQRLSSHLHRRVWIGGREAANVGMKRVVLERHWRENMMMLMIIASLDDKCFIAVILKRQ